MGQFKRTVSTGWTLTKWSLKVLRENTELLVLTVAASATFLAIWGITLWTLFFSPLITQLGASVLLYLFGIHVLGTFVVVYFNVAVHAIASERFHGRGVDLEHGLRRAWDRKGRILQWSLVSASVGLVLSAMEFLARRLPNKQWVKRALRFMTAMIGAAWSLATFFVLPVIAERGAGPFQAVQESVATGKQIWGTSVAGVVSTKVIFGIAAAVGGLVFVIGLLTPGLLGAFVVAASLLGLLVIWAGSKAANAVLEAALYHYHHSGGLPVSYRTAKAPAPNTLSVTP